MNKEIPISIEQREIQPERSPEEAILFVTQIPDLDTQSKLSLIRFELDSIRKTATKGSELAPPVVIAGDPPRQDGEIGLIQEKDVKRRRLRAKETAPKTYSEMLVCVNDLQLLRNADDEAIGAMMKYLDANKGKITHIVLNGDIVDMEQANKFGSSPDQAGTMQDEIAAVRWFTANITRMLPNAKKVFIMGNHDNRFKNYLANKTDGIEEWLRTPEEMFGIEEGWDIFQYGQGQSYRWHDRFFWHGNRAGAKSDIAKLELADAGVSVTTAHINRNMYHEERDALGNLKSGITHGGFSKDNLHFVKKANSSWSLGFGVYFWDKQVGEQPYMVLMKHGNPRFIAPDGVIFDGTGYNLREEIGLEVKRGRGRPRGS